MSTITIQKTEYNQLKQQAKAYRDIASRVAVSVIEKPIMNIVSNFKNTGKYSPAFLKDLSDGLKDLKKSKAWNTK